jgi:hypothetical protein
MFQAVYPPTIRSSQTVHTASGICTVFQLLMMGGETSWNMYSSDSNKECCITLHLVGILERTAMLLVSSHETKKKQILILRRFILSLTVINPDYLFHRLLHAIQYNGYVFRLMHVKRSIFYLTKVKMSVSLRRKVVTPSDTHFRLRDRKSSFIEQTLKFPRVVWSVKKLSNVRCHCYFGRQKCNVYFSCKPHAHSACANEMIGISKTANYIHASNGQNCS